MKNIEAKTAQEVSEAVLEHKTLRVAGSNSKANWRRPVNADCQLTLVSGGVLEHDVADQIVVVSAGATIAEIQSELSAKGQCLPLGLNSEDAASRLDQVPGTVGGWLSMNLPHSFQASCGSWRDWVIGMTIVRPDGTLAKCGSKAVKSVAGYDVAKLVVGARGTLGIVFQVILRTYPIRALPKPDFVEGQSPWSARGRVQRVLASDFAVASQIYGARLIACNPNASTLYVSCETDESVTHFRDDWQMGWGMAENNLALTDSTLLKMMERAKMYMDPSRKLNPGEFY